MAARLTYYISEGVLVGWAGGCAVHITGASGGRGGSTTKGVATNAANNPYWTRLRTTTHVASNGREVHTDRDTHGGPIPPGQYKVGIPGLHTTGDGHKYLAAVLTAVVPAKTKLHRDGFLIHGPGPHGSDGCIVPFHRTEFERLMGLLTKDSGGFLQVLEAMGVGFA